VYDERSEAFGLGKRYARPYRSACAPAGIADSRRTLRHLEKRVRLLIAPDSIDGLKRLGLVFPDVSNGGASAEPTDAVSVLYRGESMYVLRTKDGRIVQAKATRFGLSHRNLRLGIGGMVPHPFLKAHPADPECPFGARARILLTIFTQPGIFSMSRMAVLYDTSRKAHTSFGPSSDHSSCGDRRAGAHAPSRPS
jgi:hypothetical protein